MPYRAVFYELLLIALCVFAFIPNQRNFDPNVRPVGYELSYLINSGVIAAQVYNDSGTIPFWNPLVGDGEPIFEAPFSFLFNPLMTLPFFATSPMQAVKIVFLTHIFMVAAGGWVLGYVLNFKRGGRILLALLLAGNGSIVGQLSEGIFPMVNSLAYVPLVYAGLFGTLYRHGRRWIILLIVASVLMTFSGTYWYLLPTGLSAFVFTVAALVWQKHSVRLRMLSRVVWAGMLTLGLAMVRILPQVIHRNYVEHPPELDGFQLRFPHEFLSLIRHYFTPSLLEGYVGNNVYFHYIVSPAALIMLSGALLWLWWRGYRPRFAWRIVIPSLLLIGVFTFWAQGATPLLRRLYDVVPFLQEWRILGRMMAAATPLMAVLIAMVFDQILHGMETLPATLAGLPQFTDKLLARYPLMSKQDVTTRLLNRIRRVIQYLSKNFYTVLRIGMVCAGLLIAFNVLANYNRITGVQPMYEVTRAPLAQLRLDNPDRFLSVETESFFYYLPIYEIGARAAYGDPDYRPRGITPTIGSRDIMAYRAEYAVEFRENWHDILRDEGYEVLIEENDSAQSILWHSDSAPTYAYTVDPFWIAERLRWVERDIIEPVTEFTHYYDRIRLTVPPTSEERVLVITETAYPGWQVTINGTPAPLESVGELLGVRLPVQEVDAPPNSVEFRYQPVWLFRGAVISLLSLLVFMVYAAKVDRRINRLFTDT